MSLSEIVRKAADDDAGEYSMVNVNRLDDWADNIDAVEKTVLAAIEALHKVEYGAVERYLHQIMVTLQIGY